MVLVGKMTTTIVVTVRTEPGLVVSARTHPVAGCLAMAEKTI